MSKYKSVNKKRVIELAIKGLELRKKSIRESVEEGRALFCCKQGEEVEVILPSLVRKLKILSVE